MARQAPSVLFLAALSGLVPCGSSVDAQVIPSEAECVAAPPPTEVAQPAQGEPTTSSAPSRSKGSVLMQLGGGQLVGHRAARAGPVYEEGSVNEAEYDSPWYTSEEDVRTACSNDDGCKGYWERSNGVYFTLHSGSRTFSSGMPHQTVVSVKVKMPPAPDCDYEEGSVNEADYDRNWFTSLEDVRTACCNDDGCKGYWKRSTGEYFILHSGPGTFSKGVPHETVVSVMVKMAPSPTPPAPTPRPPTDGTPKYQRFPYYWPHCPQGFEITSEEECGEAIASLGVTNGGTPWTGSSPGLPRFCTLQKETDSTVFNQGSTGKRRWDLAPVCHWTGEEAPPDFFRVSRENVTEWRGEEHTITVKPEEWDYFLAFQESRKNGFSCPCNPGSECNEEEAPGKHWHPPNPEKATFDCTLWIAAWMHAEDQTIQGYFSHDSRDGSSPRMRCEAVGAVYRGEHQAGRHTTGLGALRGLQSSPGHCNSMFQESFRGFAVAHGARRNDPRGDGDVWTVLYNGGGSHISDSESCIPEGYTATGERK